MKRRAWLLDYFLPAVLVSACLLQPFFFQGIIDPWETGAYLPFINQVLRGGALFKDAVIFRGPLEIYLPVLMMKFTGAHINTLHFCFYLGNLLSLVAAVFVAREVLKTRLFVYLLVPVMVAQSFSLVFYKNWGGWRHALGAGALWCILLFIRTRRRTALFCAGILSACGFFFSLEMGIIPFVAFLVALLLDARYGREKNPHRLLAVFLQGALVVAVPLTVYMLARGSLADYVKSLLVIPLSGHTIYRFDILFPDVPHNPFQAFRFLGKPFKPEFLYAMPLLVYIPLGLILCRNLLLRRMKASSFTVIAAGAYGAAMYLGGFRQINGPQLLVSLPFAFIMLFFMLERLFMRFKERQSTQIVRTYGFVPLAVLILLFTLSFSAIFAVKNFIAYGFDLERVVFRQISRGAFPSDTHPLMLTTRRSHGVVVPGWQAEEINGVVTYLIEHTASGEPVFGFPDLGTFNFLADRPCWSRFCQMDIASYRPEWTDGFFERLDTQPPRVIVARRERDVFEPFLDEFPISMNRQRVRAFIEERYVHRASFGGLTIYHLRDEE
ncbi:MAG: hypothetical protein MJA29_01465 [Candidatus Omnitrophica bacterium]|nr:hypothetical protein [Candidatus Omnitrophota bacterium]